MVLTHYPSPRPYSALRHSPRPFKTSHMLTRHTDQTQRAHDFPVLPPPPAGGVKPAQPFRYQCALPSILRHLLYRLHFLKRSAKHKKRISGRRRRGIHLSFSTEATAFLPASPRCTSHANPAAAAAVVARFLLRSCLSGEQRLPSHLSTPRVYTSIGDLWFIGSAREAATPPTVLICINVHRTAPRIAAAAAKTSSLDSLHSPLPDPLPPTFGMYPRPACRRGIEVWGPSTGEPPRARGVQRSSPLPLSAWLAVRCQADLGSSSVFL